MCCVVRSRSGHAATASINGGEHFNRFNEDASKHDRT